MAISIATASVLTLAAGVQGPLVAASVTNQLENASFESPVLSCADCTDLPASIPGWQTTDVAFELWRGAPNGAGANGIGAYAGDQYAELNAYNAGTLSQTISTTPGTTLTWRLAHRARGTYSNPDVMRVLAGAPGGTLVALTPSEKDGIAWTPIGSGADQANISDGGGSVASGYDINWHVWSGTYVVPAGQTTTRFAFQAVSGGSGNSAMGNLLDAIEFGQLVPEPELETEPARPQPPRWTLTYDANGGSCTAPALTELDNTWVRTYDATSCIRSGYAFTGWNTSMNGTGLQFSPGAATKITGDNTLFAQWSKVNVIAVNDSVVAVKGRPVTGSLTLNDTFPAGSTFTVVSGTTRGTIVVNPDGTFTYTPTQSPRATTRSRG